MKKVEVHNLNSFPYEEQFRDNLIKIEANNYIEMEYEEAILFKGSMNSVKRNGDGAVLPESYKMLKIVQDGSGKQMVADAKKQAAEFKCQACGYNASGKQDLHIHTKEEHAHQLDDPKVAKELLKKK